MYNRTHWQDHAMTPEHTFSVKENSDDTITLTRVGTVVQQGTNLSAANFNNLEEGVTAADLAAIEALRLIKLMNDTVDEQGGFVKEVTLTNSQAYPFNNSQTTVGFDSDQVRYNQDYTIIVEIEDYEGGFVGDVEVTDKLLNGFKLAYTGSASSVTFKCYIQGGR